MANAKIRKKDAWGEGCLCMFLKAPRPGEVKTRLSRSVGKRAAAEIYRAFVEDQLEWFLRFPSEGKRVYFTPPESLEECSRLVRAAGAGHDVALRPQCSGSLGRRLEGAFRETLQGFRTSIVMGSDCPLLGASLLDKAFLALEEKELVLGPSRDGGYYLIGLSRRAPELFRNIPWSTERVLETTLLHARKRNLSFSLLEELGDIDTLRDLKDLSRELLDIWKRPGIERFPLRTFRVISWLDAFPRGRNRA